ncbi:phosphopantetheine-binding protein [Streptomyces sp. NPDC041068]|uniref:acyl carrier protein n=1 Tax=Streptomyces sp. NPDC041068 TaxID=3155130 RepID=UPI0033DEED5E
MTRAPHDLLTPIREAVAEAIGIDTEEAQPDAALIGDLGAESLDMLDIMYRIEGVCGVLLTVDDISDLLQGGIPDEEFADEDEVVNDTGLTHLEKVLPQFDRSRLTEPLMADDVLGLFTIRNLVDLVSRRTALADAA